MKTLAFVLILLLPPLALAETPSRSVNTALANLFMFTEFKQYRGHQYPRELFDRMKIEVNENLTVMLDIDYTEVDAGPGALQKWHDLIDHLIPLAQSEYVVGNAEMFKRLFVARQKLREFTNSAPRTKLISPELIALREFKRDFYSTLSTSGWKDGEALKPVLEYHAKRLVPNQNTRSEIELHELNDLIASYGKEDRETETFVIVWGILVKIDIAEPRLRMLARGCDETLATAESEAQSE